MARLKLSIKRVYDPPAAADGFRVLVDRIWPRGLSKAKAHVDLWAKDVAPSTALRQWFGHAPERWPAFRAKYRAELAANRAAVDALLEALGGRTATLLFGAHDTARNNAVVLAAALQARGRVRRARKPARARPK